MQRRRVPKPSKFDRAGVHQASVFQHIGRADPFFMGDVPTTRMVITFNKYLLRRDSYTCHPDTLNHDAMRREWRSATASFYIVIMLRRGVEDLPHSIFLASYARAFHIHIHSRDDDTSKKKSSHRASYSYVMADICKLCKGLIYRAVDWNNIIIWVKVKSGQVAEHDG